MKKTFESANHVRNDYSVFSRFSENEVLNPKAMNLIRGGDGGESEIIIPPPHHP